MTVDGAEWYRSLCTKVLTKPASVLQPSQHVLAKGGQATIYKLSSENTDTVIVRKVGFTSWCVVLFRCFWVWFS